MSAMATQKPALFGIHQSNRNFADAYYWGKNQFNSSFPVALACYMQSRHMPLVSVNFKNEKQSQLGLIDVSEVFGIDKSSKDIYFAFEHRYEPYAAWVHDDLPSIDVVVCDGDKNKPIRPLEIKLTTLPDNTTESLSEDRYGTELVIRSATTRYMALSIAQNVQRHQKAVRSIFEPVLAKVRNWGSKEETLKIAPLTMDALEIFLNKYKHLQQPLLIQPIWKTVGKSPQLADQCLDIFVWSDFALTLLFLESARTAAAQGSMTRQLRTAMRLARFIYERSCHDKVFQAPIFDGMTFDFQNDKEFAISGSKSHALMAHPRLTQPLVAKNEIKNIILGGGQKFLSPERRFDAIIYFATDLFGESA
jgi:hypothetical protein